MNAVIKGLKSEYHDQSHDLPEAGYDFKILQCPLEINKDPRIICTYYKISCYKAALWQTAHTERRTEAEMEPDGERVRRWGWVGSADISRGEEDLLAAWFIKSG